MPIYPTELTDEKGNPDVREILDSQNNLFMSRKTSLQGQVDVLKQQVKQFEEEIAGLEAQKESETQQLALIEEEINCVLIHLCCQFFLWKMAPAVGFEPTGRKLILK